MRRSYHKRISLVLLWMLALIFSCSTAMAQERREWEQYYDELADIDDDESAAKEDVYDLLCEMEEHPIDINTATKEQLEQFPFLSDIQIEEICAYLYFHGPMRSKGELIMIESLGYYYRRLLEFFVYVGDVPERGYPPVRNIAKYGTHNITAMGKIPFYDRKGDKNGYYGYKYKHYLKYDFSYSDYFKAGLVASQDAGEPFFSGKNGWGYDYYSYYVLIRRLGRLKALAVGKYRASFGLGLVVNGDYSLGKLITLSNLARTPSPIRAHSSLSDYNYLRGAAATVTLNKRVDFTAFVSYRDIDATLNDDDGTIATILKTGYHRTASELERKHNATQTATGLHASYFDKGFRFGLSALYTSFNRDLQPKTSQDYRRYYPEGNNFYNISADYAYTHYRFSVKGETAMNDKHAIATINTASCRITEDLTAILLQRFYSYKYYSLLGNSFKSGSSVQNESGVYLGVNWQMSRTLTLLAYADYAYFPWKRYQASEPSHSYDCLLQLSYRNERLSGSARYQLRMREKDNAAKTSLIYDTAHRGRLWGAYDWGNVAVKLQGDIAHSSYKTNSTGWMVTGSATYAPSDKVKIDGSLGYFNTDDYNSRIYTYEKGLLYTLSYPAFYGEGMRFALTARYALNRKLTFIGKIATTKYYDRTTISSGLQQIDGSSMTDLYLQMRIKL